MTAVGLRPDDARRPVRALLAGGRPPDRQGHRPAARRLLAGVPDGGGPAAAAPGRQPRLVADGRREDVEVDRQRRPAAGLHRASSASTRSATSCSARWRSARTPTSRDEAFLTRYNADLANDLGNLVSRATTMIHRYCGGRRARRRMPSDAQRAERDLGRSAPPDRASVRASIGSFQLSAALREIWELIGATNRYIVAREPWTLAKKPEHRRRARDVAVRRGRRPARHRRAAPAVHAGNRRTDPAHAGPSRGSRRGRSLQTRTLRRARRSARLARCFRVSNNRGGTSTDGRRPNTSRPIGAAHRTRRRTSHGSGGCGTGGSGPIAAPQRRPRPSGSPSTTS